MTTRRRSSVRSAGKGVERSAGKGEKRSAGKDARRSVRKGVKKSERRGARKGAKRRVVVNERGGRERKGPRGSGVLFCGGLLGFVAPLFYFRRFLFE